LSTNDNTDDVKRLELMKNLIAVRTFSIR